MVDGRCSPYVRHPNLRRASDTPTECDCKSAIPDSICGSGWNGATRGERISSGGPILTIRCAPPWYSAQGTDTHTHTPQSPAPNVIAHRKRFPNGTPGAEFLTHPFVSRMTHESDRRKKPGCLVFISMGAPTHGCGRSNERRNARTDGRIGDESVAPVRMGARAGCFHTPWALGTTQCGNSAGVPSPQGQPNLRPSPPNFSYCLHLGANGTPLGVAVGQEPRWQRATREVFAHVTWSPPLLRSLDGGDPFGGGARR
jgi:hypothetical protein